MSASEGFENVARRFPDQTNLPDMEYQQHPQHNKRIFIMIRGILLLLATLFAIFIVSGIIYTKLFGPIGGSASTSAPASVSAPQK
jgi:hypothetical protein